VADDIARHIQTPKIRPGSGACSPSSGAASPLSFASFLPPPVLALIALFRFNIPLYVSSSSFQML